MYSNKDIQKESGALKKKRSIGFRIFKYFSIVTGSFIFIIIFFAIWIYLSLFSGPGPMEMSDFHPFKSEDAKARYIAFEENMKKKWPVVSEERTVQTSFGKTFMRISGPVDAPPLVLLPGGGCNSLIWNANIKALSEEYRTYALDNIYDYGRSVYTREIKTGAEFSEWLDELFDSLRLGNDIRIMGYSYGGWVASQYVINHPGRLSRVVLIAPAWTVLSVSNEFVFKMVTTLIPIRYFKKKAIYSVGKDILDLCKDGKEIVDDRIEFIEIAYSSFKFKRIPNPTVLTDSELQNIKTPLLCLIGSNETMYSADSAINRLKKINPQIETEIIPGTGHGLIFTHTELVDGLILKFMK
jgi:pimeloyl-ACP methyl ester carboxylesterase